MRYPILCAGLLLAALPCAATIHPHHAPAKTHANLKHVSSKSKKQSRTLVAAVPARNAAPAVHHDAAIAMPADRAAAIQSALIKQGYLTGEPTGTWDAQTASAMEKLQGDNGWQTRITPDSRALIKLGLGPNDSSGSVAEPQ
jgi:peptidoglycan hydrolase-like protein with peptidoglycan-binding domain